MDRQDVIIENGKIKIVDSDVVWNYSDDQHIQDTINAAPGWWKETYADGVNIRAFLNSSGQEQKLARKIKIELEKDLYDVGVPIVEFSTSGKLNINPNVNISSSRK